MPPPQAIQHCREPYDKKSLPLSNFANPRRTLLLALIIMPVMCWLQVSAQSPLAKYSASWNEPRFLKANTAKKAVYLSNAEKELIHLLNLIRMAPKLFANSVLSQYPANKSSQYYMSLVDHLSNMQPMAPLQPDSLCWVSAQCHAISSGINAYDGHERITDDCRKKAYFNGECCHYGYSKPIDILISLLIDENVPSLGHRKICLGGYHKLGVSIQPHQGYGTNAVLDFY